MQEDLFGQCLGFSKPRTVEPEGMEELEKSDISQGRRCTGGISQRILPWNIHARVSALEIRSS